MTASDRDTGLVSEYDIEDPDDLHSRIFEFVQTLRTQGYTLNEIVPRMRAVADEHEDYFGDKDTWFMAPPDHDVTLPGDTDE